ncbi:MAG: oxidoreductase [Saprospirales bacterium]|nr:MAG: oxidoreductase [Saprospirales bacterium]
MEIEKSNKIAVVFGSTGLVGGHLIRLLCENNSYARVVSYSRSPLTFSHKNLVSNVIPFKNLSAELKEMNGNDLFICLGTTIRKAGSKEKFRQIDKDYVVTIAKKAEYLGFNQVLLVSSVGADKNSFFFYSRVKGEVEELLSKMDFWAIHIFQPSMLLGERNENRFGEKIAGIIGKGIDKISGNLLKKYKPIEAEAVAAAMIQAANRMKSGTFTYLSHELQDMSEAYYLEVGK